MTPLLISLLEISLIMSVAAVAIHYIMNLLSKSISPKWKYYIWGIILISLLVPFRPRLFSPIVTVDAPDIGSVTSNNTSGVAQEAATGSAAGGPTFLQQIDIPTLLLVVWGVGVVVFLIIAFTKHMRFMNTAKRWGEDVTDPEIVDLTNATMKEMNINTDISVIKSKMISVPMMAGVFKPVLFLPVYDLDMDELKYVIRHELVHYRKFDIFIKLLSVLANAIHWFNPLVYIMQRWIHTDCEVACDYEVTKTYEKDERIRYVETIIGVAKHEIKYKTLFSTNFYDGKKTMKKRLESVLSDYKMRGALVVILVAAVAITCIAAGSTLAVNTPKENTTSATDTVATDSAISQTSTGEAINPESSQPAITPDNSAQTQEQTEGSSGANIGDNKPAGNDSIISQAKAQKIALKKTGGGEVTECALDTDDGKQVYDITIINGIYEYEIEVDAKTGNIIDYDKEKIENDDD